MAINLFHNAVGYWEGDEGHSFPREYAWTQCSFPFHFRRVIGVVLFETIYRSILQIQHFNYGRICTLFVPEHDRIQIISATLEKVGIPAFSNL